MNENERSNFQTFRDCLATPLIQKSVEKPASNKSRKGRVSRGSLKKVSRPIENKQEPNDVEELADFIDVCTCFLQQEYL